MPQPDDLDRLIDRALAEDCAERDVTSEALVTAGAGGRAVLRAKEAGVLCGLAVAAQVFRRLDPDVVFESLVADGDFVPAGTTVATATGNLRALLAAERTALNFLGRMSGIATATRAYVEAVAGTGAAILATRKTAPGLRVLDLEAVAAGGGEAHRTSLADAALVKENHLAAAAATLAEAADRLRDVAVPVRVEVTSLGELEQAFASGIGVILIDNFTQEHCARAVALRDERFPDGSGPRLEASGGIDLGNVRGYAEAGVERISVGALTHSVRALDLSMGVEPVGETGA